MNLLKINFSKLVRTHYSALIILLSVIQQNMIWSGSNYIFFFGKLNITVDFKVIKRVAYFLTSLFRRIPSHIFATFLSILKSFFSFNVYVVVLPPSRYIIVVQWIIQICHFQKLTLIWNSKCWKLCRNIYQDFGIFWKLFECFLFGFICLFWIFQGHFRP